MTVNSTRMELQKLKSKLRIAIKGHKLLKDKFEEIMRQFNARIKENKELREQLDTEINEIIRTFLLAYTQVSSQQVEDAVAMPNMQFNMTFDTNNIMGLSVPKITFSAESSQPKNYVNINLEKSITALQSKFEKLIRLAELEKTCQMLAEELEKNRRRINALEYVYIPSTQETIKYISLKLGENERQNIARLMKVKKTV